MKKKIHKVKQKETPKILVEWLYLTAGAPALRRLYGYLQEKKDREAQLWEEAGVLEIGLPGGGSVDVELFPEEEWDEELAAYAAEQQADQVYTVTFTEADGAEAQAAMEELADEAGGVFCRDTEDFLPRIKGR